MRSHLHPSRFSGFPSFLEYGYSVTAFAKYGILHAYKSSLLKGFWVKWLKNIILFFNPLQAFTYNETYTLFKNKLLNYQRILKEEGWNLPVTTHEVLALVSS